MELHTILIKDIRIQPVIGVYDHERDDGQEIILNLIIRHTRPSLEDDINTTFDYTVVSEIEAYAKTHQPYLIETCGNDIAELCLRNKLVEEVEVEVIKPGALKNGLVSTIVKKKK